ncbi:MAG: hypothetical protein UZ16_OP3001000640, partial [Candidatus Hinthialibacteria bacterium OLB16]
VGKDHSTFTGLCTQTLECGFGSLRGDFFR